MSPDIEISAMNKISHFFRTLLLLFFSCTAIGAQEKAQSYYFTHEKEILPAAQASFRKGQYERTVELCRLHYILLGNFNADELREKAEECQRLTGEMNASLSAGRLEAAEEKAGEILAVNPDDPAAQRVRAYKSTRGTADGHAWVDLGLSVKWATCNVGADSPAEYGDYFAWGETSPKSVYTWESYRFRQSGENWKDVTFSKYNTQNGRGVVDNKMVLDLSDDPAHANWGGSWRTPTEKELEELVTQCSWAWIILDGRKGYEVTSKVNGNSIFLPAAGFRYEADPEVKGVGIYGYQGYYWTSSLRSNRSPGGRDFGSYIHFRSNEISQGGDDRNEGFTIRPVIQ